MSFIVKGHRLPSQCGDCEFIALDITRDKDDGRCRICNMNNVTQYTFSGHRPKWCPLGPVPHDFLTFCEHYRTIQDMIESANELMRYIRIQQEAANKCNDAIEEFKRCMEEMEEDK